MKRRSFVQAVLAAAASAGEKPPWTSVADHLIRTSVESYPFNWGEGVQMMGLMKAARLAREPRYIDYVEQWARIYEAKDLSELLNIGPAAVASGRKGYCGHWSPASAILYLYQERPDPAHLKLARAVADFIRTDAERSPERGLGHWQGSKQCWVDTLYMACPLLAELGRMEKKPEYIDDAATQLIVQAAHLQDERTGGFYHMWNGETNTHSEGFWGRGNGWVLMSLAETLEAMKKSHPKFSGLVKIAQRLARGLQATQDGDGLWHTVMDNPGSYAECSATAMCAYGLLKLGRMHILAGDLDAGAMKAWKTINSRYVKDGVVTGVSAGTGPAGTNAYRSRPVGTETWGTGAYLLAASEVARRV